MPLGETILKDKIPEECEIHAIGENGSVHYSNPS